MDFPYWEFLPTYIQTIDSTQSPPWNITAIGMIKYFAFALVFCMILWGIGILMDKSEDKHKKNDARSQ